MASSEAGAGAGVSRFSVPLRRVIAVATPESLNNGVALCRMSDRWNYCLEPMSESARVTALSVSFSLIATGSRAMCRMP